MTARGAAVQDSEDDVSSNSVPNNQYCAQSCLLGLKGHTVLDTDCLNLRLRQIVEDSRQHSIDVEAFNYLLSEWLCQDPYRKCESLEEWGK